MEKLNIISLLEDHGVKPTPNRIIVARALTTSERPVTMSVLEEEIRSVDKSNIFRTLKTFQEHHLVHVIDGPEGVLYELCLSHNDEHDEDIHVHFLCEACHRTFCLPDIAIPSVPLPPGYVPTTANYIIKGLCPDCAKRTGK